MQGYFLHSSCLINTSKYSNLGLTIYSLFFIIFSFLEELSSNICFETKEQRCYLRISNEPHTTKMLTPTLKMRDQYSVLGTRISTEIIEE